MRVEHFWLCSECSRLYDFLLLPGGRAIAVRRKNPKQVQQLLKTDGTPEAAGTQHAKESVSWANSTRQACQCAADKVSSRSREGLRRQPCEPLEIQAANLVVPRAEQQVAGR
jgi:hypothetical protein